MVLYYFRFSYYTHIYDIQALGMLSCVFQAYDRSMESAICGINDNDYETNGFTIVAQQSKVCHSLHNPRRVVHVIFQVRSQGGSGGLWSPPPPLDPLVLVKRSSFYQKGPLFSKVVHFFLLNDLFFHQKVQRSQQQQPFFCNLSSHGMIIRNVSWLLIVRFLS